MLQYVVLICCDRLTGALNTCQLVALSSWRSKEKRGSKLRGLTQRKSRFFFQSPVNFFVYLKKISAHWKGGFSRTRNPECLPEMRMKTAKEKEETEGGERLRRGR